MTERTGGSDVAITETVRAARTATTLAPLRHQVVHERDDVADGAHARAPRGQPARRARPRALLRRAARRRRARCAASRSTASRTSSARAWCRPPSSRSTARRRSPVVGLDGRHQEHHADAQRHAHLERGRRRAPACAADSPSRATTRRKRVAFGAPLARQAAARRHARGAAGRVRRGASTSRSARSSCSGARRPETITEEEAQLLRLLTPIAKLTTGKQAVAVASEVARGVRRRGVRRGHGAAAHPARRAGAAHLGGDDERAVARRAARARQGRDARADRARGVGAGWSARTTATCAQAGETALEAVAHARGVARGDGAARARRRVEAGARRFALTLGRALELALLVDHAAWAHGKGDPRPAAAARRFARSPVDLVVDEDMSEDARTLVAP